jgi:hypothetical protein
MPQPSPANNILRKKLGDEGKNCLQKDGDLRPQPSQLQRISRETFGWTFLNKAPWFGIDIRHNEFCKKNGFVPSIGEFSIVTKVQDLWKKCLLEHVSKTGSRSVVLNFASHTYLTRDILARITPIVVRVNNS